jgi:hypothetical protein
MQISQDRIKKIIKLYETDKKRDLFNWCEEYKQFVGECALYCVSNEWDYMIKKSYEDNESPVNYEDLDLFDVDRARDHLTYIYDKNEEEFKEYANNQETFNRRVNNKSDFEVFLNSLDIKELKEMFEKFEIDLSEAEAEVYEWWIISDPLKYRLEQRGEIFLNGAWGRCTTGQSISLDETVIKAFIDTIKDQIH